MKMFCKILMIFYVINCVNSQSNGEFWWLNDQVKKLRDVEVQPAKFEELKEFDNDENDKVLFHNDLDIDDKFGSARTGKESKTLELHFPGPDSLVWPQNFRHKVNMTLNDTKHNETNASKNIMKSTENNKDEFQFHFPEDDILWKDATSNLNPSVNPTVHYSKPNSILHDKIHFKVRKEENINSENICSYMEENECIQLDGLVYKQKKRSYKLETRYINPSPVCCIFPIKQKDRTLVVFPDSYEKKTIRFPRSLKNVYINGVVKQKRRFAPKYQSYITTSTPYVTKRIVTTDDEEDPYANIKNRDFEIPTASFDKRPIPANYGDQDYDDYYTEELPKPGLTGLDSDQGSLPGDWTFLNDDSVEDEYDDVGYGVSIADPRLDRLRPTTRPIKRKLPPKPSTTSTETDYRTGSETIRYQSNPDFQVLQGFKLLNLVRNRSRIYTKNSRKSTTASLTDEENSQETVVEADDDSSEHDALPDLNGQVYKGCGKTARETFINERLSSEEHSSPWLLLMVRSRRSKTNLCHATLIHPRAAFTAAICVHSATPGEVVVYAGLRKINEDSAKSQKRIASIYEHPLYKQAELAHDLAVLYWSRPLRLSVSVQPACLSKPQVGDSCVFVGWGGQGQAIHTTPRWQNASITSLRECRSCIQKRGTRLPKDAFCASVETAACVTGIGGTMMCNRNGRQSAVGLMVWRESCDVTSPILLLPAQDWINRAMSELGIL